MLLRFRVANFRSIKESMELSLVPSALRDTKESLIACSAAPAGVLLPAAVIYGANASGKSNVIEAFRWMCSTILYSHSRGTPDGGVRRSPFALDPEYSALPTEVDADFVVDGIRYHYGFAATNKAFLKEWLHSYPNDRRQMLFERDGTDFEFGRSLKGRNRIIADLTRPNSLFLSAASQNAHEELSKVSIFFQDAAGVGESTPVSTYDASIQEPDRRVIDFLEKLGTGVVGSRVLEVEFPPEFQQVREQLKILRNTIAGVVGGTNDSSDRDPEFSSLSTLQLAHKAVNGNLVYFNLDRESEGTRRLLTLLDPMFKALDNGSVFLADDLAASFHTQASEALLTYFFSKQTNPNGAQLIATTHDTNVLRCPLLRRDQVWFTEKDEQGATDLYALTDFHTKRGDNLEKGYLQGRYGAVPFAGALPANIFEHS